MAYGSLALASVPNLRGDKGVGAWLVGLSKQMWKGKAGTHAKLLQLYFSECMQLSRVSIEVV